jgi:PDZ domain-containing protein
VRRPRLTWRRGFAAAAIVVGGTALALWLVPSGQYLLLPDKAQLVEPLVRIANEDETAAEADGGIYMVDILVRKASLFERLFPGLNDGATLVPARILNPAGVSEEQRRKSSDLDMTRSQEVAAAVALRQLGYTVEATPSGAEIVLVVPGSPADEADLEPGDVIVEAEGREIATTGDLRRAMEGLEPGDSVTLAIRRSGGLVEHTLPTQTAEDGSGRAVVGVIVQQAATIELPLEIAIDAGSIGGPSAGLAFALDIVDELGIDVDQGRLVVVTGELGLDGRVEPIGGVKQKTIGAREAGADVFVVPQDNAAEARRYAEDLEIVPVETFDDALEALSVTPQVT